VLSSDGGGGCLLVPLRFGNSFSPAPSSKMPFVRVGSHSLWLSRLGVFGVFDRLIAFSLMLLVWLLLLANNSGS